MEQIKCEICQDKAAVEAVLATQKRCKEIQEMSKEEFTKLRRRMENTNGKGT